MKNVFPKLTFCLFLAAVSLAQAAVPSMNVTISDASGKAAFKGTTKAAGDFATAKLPPGNYVVQFTAKDGSVKGAQYSIVVAAGTKKVVANAVAGEKFLAGGVAMRVEVGTGLNIAGQVVAGGTVSNASLYRDKLIKMQDRGQDSHQEGFNSPISQTQDKMIRH